MASQYPMRQPLSDTVQAQKSEALIYVVDSNVVSARITAAALENYGFDVRLGHNCEDLAGLIESQQPDIIVLDQMLGKKDTLPHLGLLRALTPAHVLLLSDRFNEIDCVLGLETGADDYLRKSISGRELVARLRACLRARAASGPALDAPEWRYCQDQRLVEKPCGMRISLTGAEHAVMELLVKHEGVAVDRNALSVAVTGKPWSFGNRSVDNTIVALRKKLGADRDRGCIRNIRGVGYIFVGFRGESALEKL